MSDIKDRLKFNSGTDKVTQSVADAVSDVLNSGQAPKTRFEQQAELMGYPLQDKPKVEESFGKELQELRKAVNDSKREFVAAARNRVYLLLDLLGRGRQRPRPRSFHPPM